VAVGGHLDKATFQELEKEILAAAKSKSAGSPLAESASAPVLVVSATPEPASQPDEPTKKKDDKTVWLEICKRLDLDSENGTFEIISESAAAVAKNRLVTAMIGDCQIEALPTTINTFKSLRKLELEYNTIKALPSEIGQLRSLKHLGLENNRLKGLPDSVGSLESLSRVYLQNNQVAALPATIGKCKKLEHLDVADNLLVRIPAEIGNCTALSKLILCGNQLKEIPTTIGLLQSLVVLDLSDNELSAVPQEITQLQCLEELLLAANEELSKIPDVTVLKSLAKLSLSTAIKSDAEEVDRLKGELVKCKICKSQHREYA
jgi:Leucine-rich repeat (LRR) protein